MWEWGRGRSNNFWFQGDFQTPKNEIEKALKIKQSIKTNKNIETLDEFIYKELGTEGTATREEFEQGFEEFKIGFLLQQARLEKGLTQQELADKCGTNKGYISRIENNVKEVRISTLRRIVEIGLGGHLQLNIQI